MTTPLDFDAVEARYTVAIQAKPPKGPWTLDGIAALCDSVADVPDLLAEIRRLQEVAS